jgi:hypothetical protein
MFRAAVTIDFIEIMQAIYTSNDCLDLNTGILEIALTSIRALRYAATHPYAPAYGCATPPL